MNLEKIFDDFITSIKNTNNYATREELAESVKDVLNIYKNNKDKTPEEIINILLQEPINIISDMINNNAVFEGYTVSIAVNNINAKIYGGYRSYKKEKISDNTMFDVASVTKFYTQIIAYNLINEGYFKFSDKIIELDNRFTELNDLTVEDILTFTTTFKTNGRISDATSKEEALNRLYTASVVETNKYNYNDIGMMIMKEVMEKVTNMSYNDLLKKYITNKLNLNDTHIIVPKRKFELLTGSPNIEIGKVNDPSAVILGGYSGHAGVFASSDDLIKLGQASFNNQIVPEALQSNMYTSGIKSNRSIMGNTFVTTEKGLADSFSDKLDSKESFSVQGSTRSQLNVSRFKLQKNEYINASTILLNPSSISIERAKLEEERINNERTQKGLSPLSLVRHFKSNVDGKVIEYDLIDPRQILPASKGINQLITANVKTEMKIMLLLEIIKAYEKDYELNLNISKHI